MKSSSLAIFAAQYDALVESIYRAGSGVISWSEPLTQVCEVFDLRSVQIASTAKDDEALQFLFESRERPAEDDGQEDSADAAPCVIKVRDDDEGRVNLVVFRSVARGA